MTIRLDDTQRRACVKGFVASIISESLVRYMLKHSGYTVLSSEYLLKTKKPRFELLRDKDQESRYMKCCQVCDISNSGFFPDYAIGIPDYFVYSTQDEFFLEVKANSGRLSETQKRVFPLINEIIPVKIVKLFMDINIVHKSIEIKNISELSKDKSGVELLRAHLPDLSTREIMKIFNIVCPNEEIPYELLDLDNKLLCCVINRQRL
ncbi:hypothetical protein COV61_02340 [Candidatus Micrarchaeota archaeon CG11_big_fil_rev_8_21_14_0_20_47_5]|nr:MAG: hypothetical protein COV61_02340 [Candidatus Micrarchaeota archaeon CG11_big_fil_rev_8_21_14_0_20_47_5]